MNQKSQRRAGFYWQKKTPLVTVTEVLKVINKEQLMHWYGKEVYYALAKNPGLSERDALAAPYSTSKTAADRGTTIHSIVEAYTVGNTVETIPEFQPYVDALYKWGNEYKPEFLEREKTVYSFKYGYAGTLDALIKVNGRITLLDIKTGKYLYPEVSLQLSAYKNALFEQGITVDGMAALLLQTGEDGKGTGQYVYQTYEDSFEDFRAAQRLWCWKNKEKCTKLNYKFLE